MTDALLTWLEIVAVVSAVAVAMGLLGALGLLVVALGEIAVERHLRSRRRRGQRQPTGRSQK